MQTYYDILGVSKDATQSEIRDAYQHRVEQEHPNHSDDPNANQQFMRVKEAYDILGNPQQRAQYDKLGHDRFLNEVSGQQDPDGGRTEQSEDNSLDVTAHTRQSVEASFIWDGGDPKMAEKGPPTHTVTVPFWKRAVGYSLIIATMASGTVITLASVLQSLPGGGPTGPAGADIPIWTGLLTLIIGFGIVVAVEHLMDTDRKLYEIK